MEKKGDPLMRSAILALSLCTLLPGCAPATATAPLRAQTRTTPIDDVEPEVRREVAEVLMRLADGDLPRDRLTERANAELDAAAAGPLSARLRPCPRPIAPALLERTTRGEDRQYLYRVPCGQQGLLVEIIFNKATRINKLAVLPDKDA
jgi:hypothetical protein